MGHRWRFSLPLASFSRCIIITMVCNETKSADVNVDHHIVLILKKGTDMGDHTGISVKHDFSNVFTEGHETVLAELEKTRILRNNIPIAGYTGCLPWTNFVKLRSLSARCKVVHAHIYLHMHIYVYFLRQTLLSPAGVNMIRPRTRIVNTATISCQWLHLDSNLSCILRDRIFFTLHGVTPLHCGKDGWGCALCRPLRT